jgi:hypothetical protein
MSIENFVTFLQVVRLPEWEILDRCTMPQQER